MAKQEPLIAFIGGTGVYSAPGITDVEQVDIETPFGKTVDPITLGTLNGVRCAFVARHGRGHRVNPSEVPFRAHIYALKQLGVKYIVAVSACGSLKEELAPGDFVVVDQFIDRTYNENRRGFYYNGVVVHVQMGDPVCPTLTALVEAALREGAPDVNVHKGGTYVCMEGPQFSTRAESNLNRQIGGSVIGMTAATEAKLAREAEIAYAVVGLVTDYDCWHTEEVSALSVIEVMKKNGDNVQRFLPIIAQLVSSHPHSKAHDALKEGLMTPKEQIPEETKTKCYHLLKKYL